METQKENDKKRINSMEEKINEMKNENLKNLENKQLQPDSIAKVDQIPSYASVVFKSFVNSKAASSPLKIVKPPPGSERKSERK